MSVFRPANGFQNNCAVCNAILRIYLNLKRDIVCFACFREFTAPQRPRNDDSGRSSPTDFMPESALEQQQQREEPDSVLPADFICHCPNEWCSFKVRVLNGDTSVYKRHAAQCQEQYEAGNRWKADGVGGGEGTFVSIDAEGLDPEVTKRASNIAQGVQVIDQAPVDDHLDNLSSSSSEDEDD